MTAVTDNDLWFVNTGFRTFQGRNQMPEQIKAGDTVQLKSGGPKMTVDWVSDEFGTLVAGCSWFVDKLKQFDRFPVTSLMLA